MDGVGGTGAKIRPFLLPVAMLTTLKTPASYLFVFIGRELSYKERSKELWAFPTVF